MGSLAVSQPVTVRDSVMSFWPLFLLSVRALNSHAGPLLDDYELVDLGDLPQPSLGSFADSLPNQIFPFRVKRDLSRRQLRGGDIYMFKFQGLESLNFLASVTFSMSHEL